MERALFQLLIYAIFINNLSAQTAIKHSFVCTDYTQGKVTHAFEITRDKKLVWIYDDQSVLKTMSNIQILDSHLNPLNSITFH